MADYPQTPHRSRRGKAQVPLTREAIAEAALAQIDAKGLEGLSMRALGGALGVEAMALYHHFPSKGELLDAVLERLLDEVEFPPAGSMPPLDRLRRSVESYRRVAVRHPQAFILLAVRRFNTERTFAFYERILEVLAEAGFGAEQSARLFRLLGYYATGAGLAEIASRAQEPDATPVKLEELADLQRFPHVAAVAPYLRVANLDPVFDFGLDVIFDAVRKSAGSAKRGRRAR
ncbi:MAG TPA: TetR/AcrR family transcriptional regulator C-terminal domain-containing protein [Burkholderiales bacterium]|nr:TetR/AcrR family transcriptional regulator C-terminal domain-containing protein [Burkholderiales bacterium]